MPSYRKHRIYFLDIIRIICALLIFMRHSITMYGCTYGSQSVDEVITALTSPVMSMFFILSGFSINYSNYSNHEWDYHKTSQFYAKRLVQIIPTYILIHFLWLVFGRDSFIRWLFLTPFELTALQSMYPNIFGILHNGGTWFISCLLISYLLYPAIRGILFHQKPKTIFLSTAVTLFLLVYLPAIGTYYALGGIYSNPIFRSLEFALGILISNCTILASQFIKDEKNQLSKNAFGTGFIFIGSVIFVHFLANPTMIGNSKLGLSIAQLIIYPFFALALSISTIMRCSVLEENKLLKYLSSLTYYFYILQLVLWKITDIISNSIEKAVGITLSSSSARIVLSFTICILMSALVGRFFDKPVKSFCFNRFSALNQKEHQG